MDSDVEESSMRISSSKSKEQFSKHKFKDHTDRDNKHGLSKQEFSLFGDRFPKGYEKVRLISKSQRHIYWIFKSNFTQDAFTYNIIQQIPRDVPNFKQKMECVKTAMNHLVHKLKTKPLMSSLVLQIQEVIDSEEADIWVVYRPHKDIE